MKIHKILYKKNCTREVVFKSVYLQKEAKSTRLINLHSLHESVDQQLIFQKQKLHIKSEHKVANTGLKFRYE